MENNTNFIIGSNYFFKDFEGFESKDTDVIIMVDNLPETILNFKDYGNNCKTFEFHIVWYYL